MRAKCCPNCGIMLERVGGTKVGPLSMEVGGDAYWRGRRIRLTAAEAQMVYLLASSPGTFFKREAIYNAIGSLSNEINDVVSVLMSRTRAKFRAVDPAFDRIETVTRRGYRWRC